MDFRALPWMCSMELRGLVSSLGYLVSNRRQVLLGDIRLGGSAIAATSPPPSSTTSPENRDAVDLLCSNSRRGPRSRIQRKGRAYLQSL